MNIRSAKDYMRANIMAGNAVRLTSDPGIGKSEVAVQNAYWYRDYVKAGNPKARVGLSIQFIATANPLTATGIPWKDSKTWTSPAGEKVTHTVTDHAIPAWFMAKCLDTGEWLPAFMFDKVYLILEEWGQGSPEAKRAFAEVFRAGGTGQYYLPEGSPRIALSNISASDGVTKEFDFVNNRGGVQPVEGDAMIWKEDWADHPYQWQGRTWQVMPASKVWAVERPVEFLAPKPKDGGQWCTPRSFAAQDRYIQTVTELNNGVTPLDDPSFIQGCRSHCGTAQANSFLSYLKSALTLPSYESVVVDPVGTPVPHKADELMLMAYLLAGRTGHGDIGRVLVYVERMPRDLNIAFVKTLLRRGLHDLLNEPAMEAWLAKNSYLVGIVHSMAR
jgi:hypothetical protein